MPRTLAYVVLALTLAACATTNTYVVPAAPDVATVSGRLTRYGVADFDNFTIQMVDDKFVQILFAGGPDYQTVPITPGDHRLVVRVWFNRGIFAGGPWEALVPLPVSLRGQQKYRVNGAVKDNLVEVWLEDESTGRRGSATSSAPFARSR